MKCGQHEGESVCSGEADWVVLTGWYDGHDNVSAFSVLPRCETCKNRWTWQFKEDPAFPIDSQPARSFLILAALGCCERRSNGAPQWPINKLPPEWAGYMSRYLLD